MTIATRLADWRAQPPDLQVRAINSYLPSGITAMLVIALAYQLATLTWTLVPGASPSFVSAARVSSAAPAASFGVLSNSHLFGETNSRTALAPPSLIDAPDTGLRLTLTGIVAREGDTEGSATISSNRDSQQIYYVGQSIEGADGATLHAVYADRVLLNRNGGLETLRFPTDRDDTSASMNQVSPLPDANVSEGSLRDVISDGALRLADIVKLAPHVQESQVIGFRVNPGEDRAALEALGLRPGDIVTDINGIVLDDPRDGVRIFQTLAESSEANVTVLRDGAPHIIAIDARQVRRATQNRE